MNSVNPIASTPFSHPVQPRGDEIEALIRSGKQITADMLSPKLISWKLERTGLTLLHLAAVHNPKAIDLLVDIGFDIDIHDTRGDSPLSFAIHCGNMEGVEAIFAHNPDVNWVDPDVGDTLLHVAALRCPKAIKPLVDRGLDIDAHNKRGFSPLRHAILNNSINGVKELLRYNQNLNWIDPNCGYTLLHLAAQSGCSQAIGLLINKGLNANALSNMGYSPLVAAIFWKKIECVKELLLHDPDLGWKDSETGYLLEHFAAGHYPEAVPLLLEMRIQQALEIPPPSDT